MTQVAPKVKERKWFGGEVWMERVGASERLETQVVRKWFGFEVKMRGNSEGLASWVNNYH